MALLACQCRQPDTPFRAGLPPRHVYLASCCVVIRPRLGPGRGLRLYADHQVALSLSALMHGVAPYPGSGGFALPAAVVGSSDVLTAPLRARGAILGVMNSAVDRDVRAITVVHLAESSPDRGAPAAPLSPAAARARRYRARKRGEDVPKRKPGPEPRSVTALSREVDALRRENARLAAEVAESRKLTPMLGMRRQRFAPSAWPASSGLRWRHLTRRRTRQRCGKRFATSARRSRRVTISRRDHDAGRWRAASSASTTATAAISRAACPPSVPGPCAGHRCPPRTSAGGPAAERREPEPRQGRARQIRDLL